MRVIPATPAKQSCGKSIYPAIFLQCCGFQMEQLWHNHLWYNFIRSYVKFRYIPHYIPQGFGIFSFEVVVRIPIVWHCLQLYEFDIIMPAENKSCRLWNCNVFNIIFHNGLEFFHLKLLFEFLLYGSVCNCINLISQRQQKINVQLFLSTFYLSSDRITKSASL